jgi:hypothetical protein
VPVGKLKEKNIVKKYFFVASLNSLKKGVGSISHRCGSGDPDLYQNARIPNTGFF